MAPDGRAFVLEAGPPCLHTFSLDVPLKGGRGGSISPPTEEVAMAWKCYSCGTKNPNSADSCSKCGGNVAAPKSFYVGWVFGGGVIFAIFYLIGTFAGGVVIATIAAPQDATVIAEINATKKAGDAVVLALGEAKPEQVVAARAVAAEKSIKAMSPVLRNLFTWIFPAFLFVLSGVLVGFMSDGRTVLEAGIGAAVGQIGGFLLHMFVFKSDLGWLALGIGLVPGAALAVLGAWYGEIFQLRKEAKG
jgi:ribosomal protein L40E